MGRGCRAARRPWSSFIFFSGCCRGAGMTVGKGEEAAGYLPTCHRIPAGATYRLPHRNFWAPAIFSAEAGRLLNTVPFLFYFFIIMASSSPSSLFSFISISGREGCWEGGVSSIIGVYNFHFHSLFISLYTCYHHFLFSCTCSFLFCHFFLSILHFTICWLLLPAAGEFSLVGRAAVTEFHSSLYSL